MATRSLIARDAGGQIEYIYCHWDGYATGVGRKLEQHYSDDAKVDALMKLGDLSSLCESCEKPDGHTFDDPIKGYSVAYGRDRGEQDAESGFFKGLSDLIKGANQCGADFIYLYVSGVWTGCRMYNPFAGEFLPIKRLIEIEIGEGDDQ